MSLFARPTVTLAIVFGCFVVLIPRILLPYFRPRSAYRTDDHFRRSSSSSTPSSPLSMTHHRHNQENIIEPIMDSSSGFIQTDELISKSNTVFALPMYVVGIAVFLIYTCFKYFKNCQNQEEKIRTRYCPTNIHWNGPKKKFNYQINHQQTMNNVYDEQHDEDSYAGLDADYVEYLKQRRREEYEREQALTIEQRQMHNTLDEMKHSLSFITSKLGTNTTNMSLTNNEITQLQNRLAQTEAQMYKILNALDVASNKMNEITRTTRQSLDQPSRTFDSDEDYHQSSKSSSESEEEDDDDEKQLSYENKKSVNEKQNINDESESSYEEEEEEEEEEEALNEYDDDESESSTDRYGLMTTNYGCNTSTVDDYDLDEMKTSNDTTDCQTKVQQWQQRHHSQTLSSNHSSIDDDDDDNNDQTMPNLQQQESELRRRKHQHNQ